MTETLDLARLFRAGDRMAWSGGALEPLELLQQLDSQLERLPADISALLNISITNSVDAARLAKHIRIAALGGSATNRRFQDVGALDILPINYSMLPDAVADGTINIDCVLIQAADAGDSLNLSVMIDHLADAVPKARVVIAEINDQLPETFGETYLGHQDVDHSVRVSRPLLEIASRPAKDLEREVARHVNRLIGDGDTLEVGLGSLPDAVLEGLLDKRNLGIHSGTIGDRVVELVEAGVITNAKKPIDTGKCVTATLLGSAKLYGWAHRNRKLEMRSPRYTHDVAVHALIPHFIGINSALEVDLTGQFNSETIGGRHVGIIGGQCDFMRGTMRSPGGRNIIVLESTAVKGSLSRIVARLGDGIVTAARCDADIVVTEYGIAELKGRTVSERARALIGVAHPDHRRALQETVDAGLV